MEAIELKPDGIYVIESPRPLTEEQREKIQAHAESVLKDRNIRFLILEEGFKIAR